MTIIPAGASPFPMAPDRPDPMLAVLQRGVDELQSVFTDYLHPQFARRLSDNALDALIACRRQRVRMAGFAGDFSRMTMPCLLYAGDADPIFEDVRRAADAMPNATFLALPRYGHVQAMMESHAVLPRVMQFLNDVRE
jgi:pimeloyl-ACP methyl ester carboxylesterase